MESRSNSSALWTFICAKKQRAPIRKWQRSVQYILRQPVDFGLIYMSASFRYSPVVQQRSKQTETVACVEWSRQWQKHLFTQLPESRHHVNKCGNALIVWLRQVSFEMVAQCEEVVSQVHAVVVLDGRQVRELEQVLSGWSSRGRETTTNTFRLCWLDLPCVLRWRPLLVVRWHNVIEQLEDVPHSEEEL